MTLRIAVLGCGTIGSEIATAIDRGAIEGDLVAVYDHNPRRTQAFVEDLGVTPTVVESPDELFEADLVVEAAGQRAVESVAVDALAAGADLLPMSVGALADRPLRERIFDTAARERSGTLHIPTGAIAGLDAVKAAAATDGLESVSLTTTKPPSGLEGAPYLVEHDVDVTSLDRAETIFEGRASDAATAFPSNVNVAIGLSLAGIGPERTMVRIVADPEEENNVHRIEAHGRAGTIRTTVRNVPSPTNPKTSYLASLSAIETIRGLTTSTRIGT